MKGSMTFTPVFRRLVQAVSLVALNSSLGAGQAKWLCVPVMNCHSCSLAWLACPIGVFIHYAGYRVFPFLALGMLLLAGALLGRLLCGWVCPMGFLQDLLYRIPGRKIELPGWTRFIKYGLLALTVVGLPFWLGEETWGSFCRGCPVSAMQATIPGLLEGGGGPVPVRTVVKLGILAAVLIMAVLNRRVYCRVLCPIGAALAPFNSISLWRVKPVEGCVACKQCDSVCPTHCGPSSRMKAGEPPSHAAECVACGDCRGGCPVRQKSGRGGAQSPIDSTGSSVV